MDMFSRYCDIPTASERKFINSLVKFAEAVTDADGYPELFIDGADFAKFVAHNWCDSHVPQEEILDAFDYGFAGKPNVCMDLADKNGESYNHYMEYLEVAYNYGQQAAKILKKFSLTQEDFN